MRHSGTKTESAALGWEKGSIERLVMALVRGLEIDTLEVDVVAHEDGAFDEPLCSAVRGRLGRALQRSWCLTETLDCSGCDVADMCRYTQIWRQPGRFHLGAHGTNGWHSFWLSGLPARQRVMEGEKFVASLFLVGPARPQFRVFSAALQVALVEAGRSRGADRGPFTVNAASRQIGGQLCAGLPARSWRIRATSPLVLGNPRPEDQTGCPQAPWLPVLIHAAMRRLKGLALGYGGAVWDEGMPELPDLAKLEVHGGFRPWQSRRWSRHQGRSEPLPGLVGEVTLRGDALLELSPLLELMGIIGVGKKTSRGFGALAVERCE